jgi:hypothetical protein
MAIDFTRLPPVDACGFRVVELGQDLVVRIQHDFESARTSRLWASEVILACPGPYARVLVDCRHQVTLPSTLIAGLVRLADHYGASCQAPVLLDGACDRIRRVVAQLRLSDLIGFVD